MYPLMVVGANANAIERIFTESKIRRAISRPICKFVEKLLHLE